MSGSGPGRISHGGLGTNNQQKVEEYLDEHDLGGVDWGGEDETDNVFSADPNDYTSNQGANGHTEIKRINEMVEEEVPTAISYSSVAEYVKVGYPEDSVYVVAFDQDTGEHVETETVSPRGSLTPEDFSEDVSNDSHIILKCVKLRDSRDAHEREYPVLNKLQTRSWSACRSDNLQNKVEPAIKGEPLDWTYTSLDQDQTEVMCEEYLRRIYDGSFVNVDIPGGGREDIEHVARVEDGKPLYTQVTQSTDRGDVKDKISKLAGYVDDTVSREAYVYIFAPMEPLSSIEEEDEIAEGITPRYLEDVFDDCDSKWDETKSMLKAMLRRE